MIISGLVLGFVLVLIDPRGFLLIVLLQYNTAVYHGAIWQLFTSIIVAPPNLQGLFDVAFNALAVILLDGFTSAVYSARQYYAVFLVTAVFGNIFSLLSGPHVSSFGASGGIFGLVAGLVSYDYAVNKRLSLTLLLWFLFIFIYSSFLFAGIDWLAHAGGALLGLLMGYEVGVKEGQSSYLE